MGLARREVQEASDIGELAVGHHREVGATGHHDEDDPQAGGPAITCQVMEPARVRG